MRRVVYRGLARRGLYAAGAVGAAAVAGYGAYRIGSRIRRARIRQRKRRRIAYHPRARLPIKSDVIDDTTRVDKNDRTLHIFELTNLNRNATDYRHDERQSHMVNIRGWRIQKMFETDSGTMTEPIMVHVAVVTSKVPSQNLSTAVLVNDFFRECSDDRVQDFNGNSSGTGGMSNQKLHLLKINTDLFHVLHRWKFTLDAQSTANDTRKTKKIFQKYVPFNRRIIYDQSTGNPNTGRTYLVFWYANYSGAGTAPVKRIVHSQHICAFFNDAKDDR